MVVCVKNLKTTRASPASAPKGGKVSIRLFLLLHQSTNSQRHNFQPLIFSLFFSSQGQTCEIDINECVKAPCRNGAVCQNTMGSYQCVCQPGYTGQRCETDTDDCKPSKQQTDFSIYCDLILPASDKKNPPTPLIIFFNFQIRAATAVCAVTASTVSLARVCRASGVRGVSRTSTSARVTLARTVPTAPTLLTATPAPARPDSAASTVRSTPTTAPTGSSTGSDRDLQLAHRTSSFYILFPFSPSALASMAALAWMESTCSLASACLVSPAATASMTSMSVTPSRVSTEGLAWTVTGRTNARALMVTLE